MTQKINILQTSKLTDYKWLNLYESTYEKDGRQGKWSFASRKRDANNNRIDRPNAVVTVPVLVTPNPHLNPLGQFRHLGEECLMERKLVLIKEYRIPIQTYEYHFTAGLLEEGETIEDCVRRELKEEAGFDLLKINRISPPLPSSAGMTDESAVMVFADCTSGDSKQQLESSEDIEVILLNHAEVCEWAKKPLMYAAKTWPVMIMYEQMDSLELK